MVLPSDGTYQVNAYINDYSLDECSIIRSNDTIRPYFVNSVVNDPDIRGLVVFLQNSSGQAAGKKIWYTLTAGLTSLPESLEQPVIPEPVPLAPSPETSPASPVIPTSEVPVEQEEIPVVIESPVLVETPVIVEPEVVQEPVEPPVQAEPVEPKAVPDPPVLIELETAAEETEEKREIPVIIEAKLIPAVPGDLEIPAGFSSYPSISEPVVNPEIPEIYITEPSESRNYALSPGKTDQVISVARLDQALPAYTITESLELGQYTLMFQVIGEKTVLAAIEQPVYFLGTATLTFDDIQRYLPGFSKAAHFVPPGTDVLIEAQVISDTRLDPYIVWYSGKKRIAEGKLSEDARYLFWKAPERTGFYTIKAVLFPFKPPENTLLYGKSKELSLPVSGKSEIPGYFSDRADQFIHWYQFQNNLLDAKDLKDPKRSLHAKTRQQPRWLPHGSIYGLSIGPEDIYLLPSASFLLADNEQGSGQIFFRGLLFAQGTIFKTAFISDDTSAEPLDVNLSFNGETLILRVSAGAVSYEEALLSPVEKDESPVMPAPLLQTGDFVTFSMTFTIQNAQFTAQVYLEDRDMQSKPCTITLAAPISGEGTFQFGSETALPRIIPEAKKPSLVALLDEVGISFTKIQLSLIPFQQNEALPEML
ncbi:MAG: hypothetical protein LBD93_11560 [Treponema sp.]|nr:hypothetical protein [Treponema sp.]